MLAVDSAQPALAAQQIDVDRTVCSTYSPKGLHGI